MIRVRGPHLSEALGGCPVCLCLRPALRGANSDKTGDKCARGSAKIERLGDKGCKAALLRAHEEDKRSKAQLKK